MDFNKAPSTTVHLDLNSCFASVEQQSNPLLRGRPIAVAAYNSPRGCVLAASIEAKKLGIKTGVQVFEAKRLCPQIVILTPDPDKYRFVHLQLRQLLLSYTNDVVAKSIDEFVLKFDVSQSSELFNLSRDIKKKIRLHIGDWLTVSIGIGPNRFLAKQASNLKKPDGLEEINFQNYQSVYSKLSLTDLHGINTHLSARLGSVGIYTVTNFYNSDISHLRQAFHSINSYYWYLRLRGYEIDSVDFGRKSFGHMYSLPKQFSKAEDLAPVLQKLVEKTGFRLRSHSYYTSGIHLGLLYTDHSYWHQSKKLSSTIFSSADIYRHVFRLLLRSPLDKPVANIAVSCFGLKKNNVIQLDLFNTVFKNIKLSSAIDGLNKKYGHFVVSPANMINTRDLVVDRIGFGGVDSLISP